MPFTHLDIEAQKSRHVALLFSFLVLLYAGSLLALLCGVRRLFWWDALTTPVLMGGAQPRLWPSVAEAAALFGIAVVISSLHWAASTRRLLDRVLEAVMARPIDAQDTYHARFANIVQEVAVALGGRVIEPFIIPTPAVNACAVSDLNGRAAIAVTEGALAVLSRPQLEAVVGHEAAHIARGDSVSATVSCSLFALHEEALKRLSGAFDIDDDEWFGHGARWPGVIVFVLAVLWLTTLLKKACEMLISREKEYRADAVAVRLTREPLSLAEALGVMSRKWRGVGTRGESLSSLFILDTGTEYLSETEGLWADLFSTHPPTERRIALLLGMAHADPAAFERALEERLKHPQPRALPAPVTMDHEPGTWMLQTAEGWIGPFTLEEMAERPDVTPESWVQRTGVPGSTGAMPAHYDPQLLQVMRRRYASGPDAVSPLSCPNCRIGLSAVLYEGAPLSTCPACHGCYAEPGTMTKVFARREYDFPEPVKRLGELLLSKEGSRSARKQLQDRFRAPLTRSCPTCGSATVRKFYTEAYPIEVEQCWSCGLAWFDRDELELAQYLYERRQAARGEGEAAG